MKRYTKTEWSLLISCFFAYTAAYITRCNLSPSLDAIAKTFGISTGEVGLLPTCFAIPYALGQVFSGTLADRQPAPRLMMIGLLGSVLVNILFSLSPFFPMLVVLWLINGILQSLIWTPIVRILAVHFRDSVRDSATFFVSLTLIFGYLIAWALSGLLTSLLSWRVAILASGLLAAALAIPSLVCMKRIPVDYRALPPRQKSDLQAPVKHLFLRTNLILLLLACFANGYARDGITNWAAKLLMDTQGIDLSSAVGIILIIPAVNFLGIRLGEVSYRRSGGNAYIASAVLFGTGAVLSLVLPSALGRLWVFVITLVGTSAMTYGLNPLLTIILPMQFSSVNRVATAAGLMDAMIYVGSSFSGSFAGYLADQIGWNAVFISWAIVGALSTAIVAAAGHVAKKTEAL